MIPTDIIIIMLFINLAATLYGGVGLIYIIEELRSLRRKASGE